MIQAVGKALFGEGGLLKVRGLLSLGVAGVTLAMWFLEKQIAPEQLTAVGLVWGLYFGSRIAERSNRGGSQ